MKYAVTVIKKELRKSINKWITDEVFYEVVEAESKQQAYKDVRKKYNNTTVYRLGKVVKSNLDLGTQQPNIKELFGRVV